MQLVLKGKNFVVSDRIREYVEQKVTKLDRYLPEINEAHVEFTKENTKSSKDRNVVQLTLRTNGKILRAEDRSEAVYSSIDAVVDKMHRQIVRYKGKRRDRWQGQGRYANQSIPEELPDLTQEILDEIAEEQERKIVRVKRFHIDPMTAEEAVEQMQLLEHDFFVFFNPDTGRINVLYRRSDKNYGLIDPDLS